MNFLPSILFIATCLDGDARTTSAVKSEANNIQLFIKRVEICLPLLQQEYMYNVPVIDNPYKPRNPVL